MAGPKMLAPIWPPPLRIDVGGAGRRMAIPVDGFSGPQTSYYHVTAMVNEDETHKTPTRFDLQFSAQAPQGGIVKCLIHYF